MKKIIVSLGIIGIAAATVASVTIAYFTDTETSAGNIFTAGAIDLKVDHAYAMYNGEECVSDCVESGGNLVLNGGFETPVLAAGTWAVYPDASQTSWTVESGDGLEIQNNAAGAPHSGSQLAELDSNNSSAISQVITTVVGEKYRLRFYYSPRPGIAAPDNSIGVVVKITGGSGTIVNDIIGASSSGGSVTDWQEFIYDFIAEDASTKIMFSDLGTSNSFGGYLDDISVVELDCADSFPSGGTCALWGEKNLGTSDTFWNFDDIKPGDYGINIISLHVYDNDAYACLIAHDITDDENVLIDPEEEAGDVSDPEGELSQFIKVFSWEDSNENNAYDIVETILLAANSPLAELMDPFIALTASNTKYIGLAWCIGEQSVDGGGVISCNGNIADINIAQTDIMTASITAYAEQQRHNNSFSCANANLHNPSSISQLSNGGFETGDFTWWLITVPYGASADVVSSHTGSQSTSYAPIEGSFFALLKTDGPGSLTKASQQFEILAGQTIKGWAAFDARDSSIWNDYAQVRILDSANAVVGNPWHEDVVGVGDHGDGPWEQWEWTASTDGTYTVEFSVTNALDSDYESYALFDANMIVQ